MCELYLHASRVALETVVILHLFHLRVEIFAGHRGGRGASKCQRFFPGFVDTVDLCGAVAPAFGVRVRVRVRGTVCACALSIRCCPEMGCD